MSKIKRDKAKNPNDSEAIIGLGINVRKQRTLKEVTMVQLAGLCEVEYSTISKIELGQVNTTITMITRIAKALRISPCLLLDN